MDYKLRTVIKDGTRDYMFGECELKRSIVDRLLKLYKQWGYAEIMSPTLEYYNVFNIGDTLQNEDIYKLTDEKNRLLSLRADCTMPIARIAASKLNNVALPFRLCYSQNVFNNGNKLIETTQSGVELIGSDDIRADIELLTLSVMSQKTFFNGNFRIELGHGQLFKVLTEEFQIDEVTAETARQLIENKNFAALETMELPTAIKILPRMFGDISVLNDYLNRVNNSRVEEIINYLKNIYEKLDSIGFSHYISFDLGLVHRLEYYTGIIFRGYVAGSGQTVLSGGRYDKLLNSYGKDLKAIGFAISVDEIFDIMKNQQVYMKKPDCLIFYKTDDISTAYDLAKELTYRGQFILMSSADNVEAALIEATAKGIKTLYIIDKKVERREI
ncbi:MAG: phosphoribosyltransferase regulatory subunit [Clostridia bacterium]|jgi:ATP phosphoribosyltransferase regulatory subunit|nr:phosphoribosyltransferase regulatory subunit [Clostridia bacterium]